MRRILISLFVLAIAVSMVGCTQSRPKELKLILGESASNEATIVQYELREPSLMVGGEFWAEVRLPHSTWRRLKVEKEFRYYDIASGTYDNFTGDSKEIVVGGFWPEPFPFQTMNYEHYYVVRRELFPETREKKKVSVRSFVIEAPVDGADQKLFVNMTVLNEKLLYENSGKIPRKPQDPFAD